MMAQTPTTTVTTSKRQISPPPPSNLTMDISYLQPTRKTWPPLSALDGEWINEHTGQPYWRMFIPAEEWTTILYIRLPRGEQQMYDLLEGKLDKAIDHSDMPYNIERFLFSPQDLIRQYRDYLKSQGDNCTKDPADSFADRRFAREYCKQLRKRKKRHANSLKDALGETAVQELHNNHWCQEEIKQWAQQYAQAHPNVHHGMINDDEDGKNEPAEIAQIEALAQDAVKYIAPVCNLNDYSSIQAETYDRKQLVTCFDMLFSILNIKMNKPTQSDFDVTNNTARDGRIRTYEGLQPLPFWQPAELELIAQENRDKNFTNTVFDQISKEYHKIV